MFHTKATQDAMRAEMESEQRMNETPEGRKAFALRAQGLALSQRGDVEGAYRVYEQAAACFQEGDTSDGAAAAWHDLGEALLGRGGYWKTTLPRAAMLFELALKSPGRKKDIRRYGQTLGSLATCLRRLAMEAPKGAGRDELMKRSIASSIAALELANPDAGPAVLQMRGRTLISYGNTLMILERWGTAIGCFREALEMFGRAAMNGLADDHSTVLARFNLFCALVHRARKNDVKDARRLLGRLLELDFPPAEHAKLRIFAARLELAESHGDKAGKNAAARHLLNIHPGSLRADLVRDFCRVAVDAGCLQQAAAALYEWLEHATGTRTQAASNAEADVGADEMQRVAWQLSSLERQRKRPIAAFLALENVSGLKWVDALLQRAERDAPGVDPVLMARHHAACFNLALQKMALQTLEHAPQEVAAKVLHDTIEEMAKASHPEHERAVIDEVARFWRGVIAKGAHPSTVRVEAERQQNIATEVHAALSRNPAWEALHIIGQPMTAERLAAIAEAYPDTVFMRFGIRDHLVAISVWWESGHLASATIDIETPAGVMEIVSAVEGGAVAVGTRAVDAVAHIDLSVAFGPPGKRRLVVLPNSVAAKLPVEVLGPAGRQALDRFDSVVWMPSLVGLEVPRTDSRGRVGTIALMPPGTVFGELAFSGSSEVNVIAGALATHAAYAKAAPEARVLALYTHGTHREEETNLPVLHLADGPFHAPDLGRDWEGIERVELWACESGVDESTEIFAPTADEPYGMDGQFLVAGARSTIGTLWSVSDLVTAFIARRFRQLVDGGVAADVALHAAKRWWRDVGLDVLVAGFWEGGEPLAVRRVASLLGSEATLAPAPAGDAAQSAEVDVARLKNPLNWSGYRFMGDWRTDG